VLTPRRAGVPTFLAAALLVIFSASGLMAGGVTFALTGGITPGRTSASSRATATVGSDPTPTPSPTPITSAVVTDPFSLSIALDPMQVHSGAMLVATVSATDQATHLPIAGLRCYLDDPTDGSAPLLTRWPAATLTDASGQAHWTIAVPSLAPGIYEIGYGATGTSSNRWQGQRTIEITS
jgi:hypothetical protein